MKEVALKKCRKKYFTQLYISRYPFIPTNPLLAAMSFFFRFSSKILYADFLNGSTSKKKLHQMCYCDVRILQTKSTMYKQCKQNSRNFAKKVLVIKLDPPKDFDKLTRLHARRFSRSRRLRFGRGKTCTPLMHMCTSLVHVYMCTLEVNMCTF